MAATQSLKRRESYIDRVIQGARLQIAGGDNKGWVPSVTVKRLLMRGATIMSCIPQETGVLVHLNYDGMVLVTVFPPAEPGASVH